MANEIVPYDDLERMAIAIAKSGLFGITKPEQAIALMSVAQAEGLHPATAARDYHIVQGRPTLKADAMLARFVANGGSVRWNKYTDEAVSATFSHPKGGTVEIEWDIARAKKAELGNRDNWKKYPRQMLRSRVVSEGVRTVYPGVAVGIYTPEEAQDMPVVGGSSTITPDAGVWDNVRPEVANDLHDYAERMAIALDAEHTDEVISLQNTLRGYSVEEQAAGWNLLNSKQRTSARKIIDAAKQAAKPETIGETQNAAS